MSRAHYTYKRALVRLREQHREEFDELPTHIDYKKRLAVIRERHTDEFLQILGDVRRNVPPPLEDPFPSRVKPGLAACFECGEPLLQHRIGQCRPDVYSTL